MQAYYVRWGVVVTTDKVEIIVCPSVCLFVCVWAQSISALQLQGPFLLTWINFNPSMDK